MDLVHFTADGKSILSLYMSVRINRPQNALVISYDVLMPIMARTDILAKLLYIPFWRMPMIYNAMSFFKLLVNLTYGCYEGGLRLG